MKTGRSRLVLPQGPTKDQAKLLNTLRLMPGPEFDKSYVDLAGNKAQLDTLNLLKKIYRDGQDGDLKMLAQELQGPVEANLKRAREISGRAMSERR